jgi:chloramphenicol-sensitive protein RarD
MSTSLADETPRAPGLDHRGLGAAIGAFAIWGLLPLYLKPLAPVPALEVIAHRSLWCCVLVVAWLMLRNELGALRAALADPDTRRRLFASTALITINWTTYVWAVASGHVIESSLGYFINPLVNVLLGVVVLHERLNRAQWIAVSLAGAGVAYLTIMAGRAPWVALVLACSFGLYGFTRKLARVEAVAGLAAETSLLAPLALAYLLWLQVHGSGSFGRISAPIDVLLITSGLVTAVPLALFAYGARRIPYSLVGIIQYLGPSLQLLLGVFLFREPFPAERALGFGLIWSALLIYLLDGYWRSRKARRLARDVVNTSI